MVDQRIDRLQQSLRSAVVVSRPVARWWCLHRLRLRAGSGLEPA
jgi:hypothetical protein